MNKRRKLLVVILGLVLLTTFGMPATGKAQGIIYGERIDEGQVVDQNVLLNGTEVAIDGTVNGDVLAFGRTITVNGSISGSLLAVGETVTINGQVSGNVMAGAVLMELGSEGQVGRELYFAGARLTLPDGSAVQRDLYMVGLETQLSGDIGRDIHAIIGPLQIFELIFIPLRDRITLIGAVQPEGIDQSKAPAMAGLGAGALAPNSYWLASGQQTAQQAAQIDAERLQSWAADLLRNLIALLVLGLIGAWLVPAPINWAGEKIKQAPWRMALSGLTVYIVGWFIVFLIFLLIVGLAFFFYSVTLANMGFLLGTLGLTGLGLGVSVFWFSIAYVSKLIIAILVGRLLLQRLAPRYAQSNLWPTLLGIVLYALVASIPYLGWVVATIVTFFGLGALWAVSVPIFPRQKEVESMPPALVQTD
ncbi:MAG: polymer-forming cytoskeletal protein [Anaerolineales bacterium]|jgi:cytoskeletal protein CcmA (bactofilin family)